ncbi:hypothetical protein M427DRAFT_434524 [Gonapodya prolifera JEL478]|uniref:Uncharacterized protein n=1 Tax=Gonapodya prolifera (strain JEL478) TaxID=1344416 RepID=A0A139ATA6_GONPJ|nr:hypothetical protein M427DRAFT_434524 [Gonapodya prolifera JEL478]|eukprot:KXS19967.1 hypothetical protein M427DRAFT_434524 [Gonapodya prolifera JEL478]
MLRNIGPCATMEQSPDTPSDCDTSQLVDIDPTLADVGLLLRHSDSSTGCLDRTLARQPGARDVVDIGRRIVSMDGWKCPGSASLTGCCITGVCACRTVSCRTGRGQAETTRTDKYQCVLVFAQRLFESLTSSVVVFPVSLFAMPQVLCKPRTFWDATASSFLERAPWKRFAVNLDANG